MKTKVKFLYNVANDDIFAYFPETKESYSHIGQHSACSPEYANESIQATSEQVKHLRRELEAIGYKLSFESERVIKCPFFNGEPDLSPVLKELNDQRRQNGLYSEISERELEFNFGLWVNDYCASIGAKFVRHNCFDLWYKIDLAGIAKLKATKWDFENITDERYISNFDQLVELETEQDRENKAEQLTEQINDNLYKFGGVCFGSQGYYCGGFSLIELNGGLIKYRVGLNFDLEFKAIYEVNDQQKNILETILNSIK